jgi:amino acid transporter
MLFKTISRHLLGKPLENTKLEGEQMPKWKALPIFSSDALSSVGYGPEQIAIVLASVPTLATYRYFGPIVLAIIALLFIVALSYTQVVRVNPGGGGSYGIAMKYLGVYPALTAGAALLADYILTVAVSISSGTAALVSAFPVLHPYHVYLDLGVLILMMIVNLRGTREASTVFVWPTYFFLAAMGITLIGGFYQIWNGTLTAHTVAVETVAPLNQTALMLIVLRAFANGCSSMTGIEAIANGVTMFKAPQQKNAIETTAIMACILAIMLGGLGYLIIYLHLLPTQGYTLLSLLVEDIFSRTLIYYVIQILMMVILYIAANTAYNGLPPLLSFMAVDGYAPRYFANRGERLSYSNGIQVLTLMAGILIVLFQGNIEHLISLYAIGVFLSFTIAQSAMVVYWRQCRERNWRLFSVINGFGALVTACVVVIVLITKFIYGAWIIVLLIPTLVYMFLKVHHHYDDVREQLLLTPEEYTKVMTTDLGRNIIIIPIASPTQAVAKAIRYAKIISGPKDKIYAVHVYSDDERGKKIKTLWRQLEPDIELIMLQSPYRQLTDPLITFIQELRKETAPKDTITVLIPEFETKKLWHRLLHNQSGWLLRLRTLPYLDVVVSTVPLQFTK